MSLFLLISRESKAEQNRTEQRGVRMLVDVRVSPSVQEDADGASPDGVGRPRPGLPEKDRVFHGFCH